MPESKFLEFCRVGKIVTSSMYNKLKGRLDDRNGAAHPSGATTTPKFAEAYIEDMVENVILKFSRVAAWCAALARPPAARAFQLPSGYV
jgi:hypothetical protein